MQEATATPKSTQLQVSELEVLADTYLTDPAFATCRSDEELWDTTIADGLDKS